MISLCMFSVSKALLISSATVIVRTCGAIWLNPLATVLFSYGLWWSTLFCRILRCSYLFFIFVISKLHILFGYFVDENGVSFTWSTNHEPLFSFMHGRSSHLSLHIIAPPGILYTHVYLDTDLYCMFHMI